MTAPTEAEQGLTARVHDVTADLHEITAALERRRLAAPIPDPRLLAIVSEMETRINRAVADAAEKMRRLDASGGRLS